jgi:hypothetical protein
MGLAYVVAKVAIFQPSSKHFVEKKKTLLGANP